MHAFRNLKLIYKLALPLALLVGVAASLVGIAKLNLDSLAARTQQLADVSAARQTLLLKTESALNDATVQEKNIILETRPEELNTYHERYRTAEKLAVEAMDDLMKLAGSDERRAAVASIRRDLTDYFAISAKSVALGLANENKAAFALSSSDGRRARAAIRTTLGKRIELVSVELRDAKRQAADEAASATRMLIALACAGILLGSAVAAAIVILGVTRPLARITAAMGRLAEGDLAVAVDGGERTDEIGRLARALAVFKDNALAQRRLEAEQARESEAKMRRAERLDAVTRSFEASATRMTHGLAAAASEMEATAESMTGIADATNQRAVSVASAATQTSSNVQTVASATEELAATISEISAQVGHSVAMAGSAVESVRATDATIRALNETAERIGAVVAMISGIAGQTNLLALNATIEAARAGEAGRGFAVVATEVKELAGQTSRATEEVGQQVTAIQSATRSAVEAMRAVGEQVSGMSQIATAVAAAMEEQGAATREIARNVQEAAHGTGQVTESITDVRRGASDTGSAATQVLGAARELAQNSETLSRTVAEFLDDVKAA